ncbi:RNA polymerase sigma factor [Paenibacillus validus]|uniref:RNA polymerase sigma factor n=1 Tax=Paenibacillus validus TaxID=44253 RepID=UPI002E1F5C38|nr:sigma factor [Paenibacillus validus]MED4606587.1 sigma factor [Paenibacillus validus]
MGSMTDEQLVDLIRQGDDAAYRILMERYQDYVYTLIYRMVEHRETAEDLTQEVFLKLSRGFAAEDLDLSVNGQFSDGLPQIPEAQALRSHHG